MAAAIATRRPPPAGLRPVALHRDLAQIASLIEVCFGPTLDPAGQSAVREMQFLGRVPWLLWLLAGMTDRLPSWGLGFVWEADGRVVGNVSTQRSSGDAREWIIANVAVHPDYRRRGVGLALTRAALALARSRGARTAILQVDHDNVAAIDLYRRLGFFRLTTRTNWLRPPGAPPESAPAVPSLRRAAPGEWHDRFELARLAAPEGLAWDRPLREADFRPSSSRWLAQFLTAEWEASWVVREPDGRLAGSLGLHANDGGHDTLTLLVRPDHRGRLEGPLLANALRWLGRRPLAARLEYPSDAPPAAETFEALGFRPTRTLTWMKVAW